MSSVTSPPVQLRREFTLISAFSLAFAYISPIVAVYGVFALALALVGPGYWLAIPVALAGQLLVSLSLGEVASRFPYEGSLYQWAGRLIGPRFGWLTGWTYVWTVMIAMATVTLGAAGFWSAAFHLEPSTGTTIVIALALLALCTVGNLIGRRPLKIMIGVSIIAEIIGSIGLGVILLGVGRRRGAGSRAQRAEGAALLAARDRRDRALLLARFHTRDPRPRRGARRRDRRPHR